jgi:hypothetical protein
MNLKQVALLTCLICLILASAVFAQEEKLVVEQDKIVRLYQKDLPAEVNLQAFLETGEVKLADGVQCFPSRIVTGPAPAPYPTPLIWEKGIEQLGPSSATCDGILFLTGGDWSPYKLALMLWKIRIPQPAKRLASEFGRDLTLSLWVDLNEDKAWGKDELMVNESFNIHKLFPYRWSSLEIWYLTWFVVPKVSQVSMQCGGGWTKYTTKLWMRGALSYDDSDVSPAGQFLFGEVEDYQVTYEEIKTGKKTKG